MLLLVLLLLLMALISTAVDIFRKAGNQNAFSTKSATNYGLKSEIMTLDLAIGIPP